MVKSLRWFVVIVLLSCKPVDALLPLPCTYDNRVEGDANLDGVVDFEDFLILSNNFGEEGTWEEGDFDCSGVVSFGDLYILMRTFGFSD